MSSTWHRALVFGVTVAATAAGCRTASPGTAASAQAPLASAMEPVQSPAARVASGPTARLDMDAIFPPGDGRDLVLNNCLACHGFVRFVLLQRTREQWAYVRRVMRPLVGHLDEPEADALFGYLERHFNDSRPVPDVPDWFLKASPW
jgi:mono/diheme cytochrome c family protein